MAALVAAAGFRSSTGALLDAAGGGLRLVAGHHERGGQPQPHRLRPHRALRGGADGALRRAPRGRRRADPGRRRQRADPGHDQRRGSCGCCGASRSASAPARWRWSSARSSPTAGSCGTAASWSASSRPPARPGSWSSCRRSPSSPTARAGAGRPAWSPSSRCCWCRWCWWLLRDHPADVGTTAYGATAGTAAARAPSWHRTAAAARAWRSRSCARAAAVADFWILFGTFWICGWSTNGLIGTHFIPAAHDHGMPATTSAGPARPDRHLRHRRHHRQRLAHRPGRQPLPAVRLLLPPRALAARGAVAARPDVHPSLFVFILFYGLDWVATVPPTVALCRQHFGVERAERRLRLGLRRAHGRRRCGRSFAGWIREWRGDYFAAWLTAGALCLSRRGLPADPGPVTAAR